MSITNLLSTIKMAFQQSNACFGPIRSDQVGFYIGTRGRTINKIKSDSGAWVQIMKPGSSTIPSLAYSHWFSVSGRADAVSSAFNMLSQIAASVQSQDSKPKYGYFPRAVHQHVPDVQDSVMFPPITEELQLTGEELNCLSEFKYSTFEHEQNIRDKFLPMNDEEEHEFDILLKADGNFAADTHKVVEAAEEMFLHETRAMRDESLDKRSIDINKGYCSETDVAYHPRTNDKVIKGWTYPSSHGLLTANKNAYCPENRMHRCDGLTFLDWSLPRMHGC